MKKRAGLAFNFPNTYWRRGLALSVAMAIAICAILFVAQPVLASPFYITCGADNEAENFSIGEGGTVIVRIHDRGSPGSVAFFHTDDGTATSPDDFPAWDNNRASTSGNTIRRDLTTKQDSLAEGNEKFTIRFSPTGNVWDIDDPDKDHKCTVTIIDDDPNITAVEVTSSPIVGDTYGAKETIEISVTYNAEVDVDTYTDNFGLLQPRFTLSVGGTWRSAPYLRGSGTDTLVFGYQVQSADTDANGVSPLFPKDNITGGDAITAKGTDLVAFETFDNIGDQAGHKVDGSTVQGLFVTNTEIISTPAHGDTYGLGEHIEVETTFSEPANVTGSASVGLYVGLTGNNYAAAWRGAGYNRGSGTDKLVFRYTVKRTDLDTDGFTVVRGSGNTGFSGSGNIRAVSDNTQTRRDYRGLAPGSGHKVDGRPRAIETKVVSTPTMGDTYLKDEHIEVELTFSEPVTVDPGGTFIVLRMQSGSTALGPPGGGAWRGAHYNRGSGTNKLVFRYPVKKGDLDNDGVVVVNGDANYGFGGSGTIRAVSDNAKRSPHYSGLVGQKVDARPRVIDIAVVSTPTAGDTYLKDEHIEVELTFSEPVNVTGGVSVGLYVGLTGNNYAAAWRGAGYNRGSGTNKLVFRYTVKRADLDRDGFSVIRGSANTGFSGSGIRAVSDNAERSPHYSGLAAGTGHRVDGRPYVTGVAVLSTPTMGDTYGRGELFSVALTFSEKVVVKRDAGVDLMLRMESDSTSLVADINDNANRFADYVRGSGTDTLVFSYQIEQADTDNDGLVVSRGESIYYVYRDSGIFAEAEDDVAVNRSHPGLAAGTDHKADGSGRSVFATPDIRIISEPAEGGVYGRGEKIEVRMGFSEAVAVSGDVWISLLLDDASLVSRK